MPKTLVHHNLLFMYSDAVTTLSIITLRITTFSITSLSIMTVSIMINKT
jgi:hypothetical protein